jgi:IS5 family transposase
VTGFPSCVFWGLSLEDSIPDAKTVWLFRDTLAKAGAVEKLFARFDKYLEKNGLVASGGQMIDASIIPAPKQRNSRDENKTVKSGKTPESWQETPAKLRQKDVDARWTKKNNQSHYGYKNHINADKKNKLIRRYKVTDASVHDSKTFEDVFDKKNSSKDIWADSAYRSEELEEKLKKKNYRSHIHYKGTRNHPLSEAKKATNNRRSKVRARVEHVFGAQSQMGGKGIRCIGITRTKAVIGLRNLVYNMQRFVCLSGGKYA